MPHFVQASSQVEVNRKTEGYVLFLGRLDPEKGVNTLLEAWIRLDIPLKIRGSGRLDESARNFVKQHGLDHIEFVERLDANELAKLIGNARFLIMPSEGYYETFGMVIIEAFSGGVPVLASNLGVVPELVTDKQTGLLFEAGNASDLAQKAKWLWEHPAEASAMGRNGRKIYRERFTAEKCYETLIDAYGRAINSK
jgi:glycosyltransferase involved in cell wall biosynthesis